LFLALAGIRGCSADIVILEEAAFMSPELFFQVVCPLLGVANTALLAISTPMDGTSQPHRETHTHTATGWVSGVCDCIGQSLNAPLDCLSLLFSLEFNYYTELMNLKDQWGQLLFSCIQLGLTCKACADADLICNHRLTMNPHWKPPERTAKVDAIMSVCRRQRRQRRRRVVDDDELTYHACFLFFFFPKKGM
jgi:hypothetical protein